MSLTIALLKNLGVVSLNIRSKTYQNLEFFIIFILFNFFNLKILSKVSIFFLFFVFQFFM